MARLTVFNSVTMDGFFTGEGGDLSWAHKAGSEDPEWDAYVQGNAKGGGTLVFGRVTYQMMAGFWPTPAAIQQMPAVAEQMNRMSKVVFSKSLDKVTWSNTRLVKSDLAGEIRKLKKSLDADMTILGSGTLVSQLAKEGLVDGYTLAMVPVVIGKGRTMFEGVKLGMKLVKSQPFKNGNVVLTYEPT
jgi:dihydrofolate reductase